MSAGSFFNWLAVAAAPTGPAGIALNNNFIAIAQAYANQAYAAFDGRQNYASVAAGPAFFPGGPWTLEFWGNNQGNYAKFLGNWTDPGGPAGYFIEATDSSGNSGTPTVIHTGTAFQTAGAVSLDSPTLVYDSNWHHYALQYDGSVLALFIDGTNVNQTIVGSDSLVIGSTPFNLGQPGDGAFLNHSFWIRQAKLSSVARYSLSGFTPAAYLGTDNDTICYYTCQTQVGSTIPDDSGNGYDLTLHGSPPPTYGAAASVPGNLSVGGDLVVTGTLSVNSNAALALGSLTAGVATIQTWVGGSGFAYFGNAALASSANAYAVLQDGSGNTFVNAATGAQLNLSVNNGHLITMTDGELGFFGAAPVAQPTVSGSQSGGTALPSLITMLATLGLIVDGTTP